METATGDLAFLGKCGPGKEARAGVLQCLEACSSYSATKWKARELVVLQRASLNPPKLKSVVE